MSIFLNFGDIDDDLSNESSSGNAPVLTWKDGKCVWVVKQKMHSSEPKDEPPELTLSNKDVGSFFLDGHGVKWEILDFDPREEYQFFASYYFCGHQSLAEFNQFGHRKGCTQDSEYSLKSIV